MEYWHFQSDQIRFGYVLEPHYCERIDVCVEGQWIPALQSAPYATVPMDERHFAVYAQTNTEVLIHPENGVYRATLEHPDHTIVRKVQLTKKGNIDVQVTLCAKRELRFRAVEDIWEFVPKRRETDNELLGPLDFVWSQRMKSFPSSFIPHYSFKFPAVMLQQDAVFTALVAGLEQVDETYLVQVPLGFDLQVTCGKRPRMSYGAIVGKLMTPNRPCEAGHAQIVRGIEKEFLEIHLLEAETCTYRYTVLASTQPKKLGYRSAVRYLWARYGREGINCAKNLPENKRYPKVHVLQEWENAIWKNKAEKDYFCIEESGKVLGGLTGRRQGEWFSKTDHKHDVWYACWLQELVTGYGLNRYSVRNGEQQWVVRSEHMLNWILSAPRTQGMFPVICYYEKDGSKTWLNDDGWAGFYQEFHSLQMSWTAWLMLRWAITLFPTRKDEILEFCVPYGDFLVHQQHEDGCIPSWFGIDGKPSRQEFRDFNAETATSGLFLLELSEMTANKAYLNAGMKAVDFLINKVVPRQRWFDLETFLSCSKKSFDFYDGITTQYPQCNLSQIHATFAFLRRYQISGKEQHLKDAEQIVDYLLLTQQVWNHPLLSINTFGGFTVQNGDNEWSDAREGLCVIALYHYYLETGRREYLERCIAARNAGFEILPYENWAHCGPEGMQYDSSLLWGGGVVLAAAEYLEEHLGTFVVDADHEYGIGVDNCLVKKVQVLGGELHLTVKLQHATGVTLSMRIFSQAPQGYTVLLNGVILGHYTKQELEQKISWNYKR